MMKKMLAVLLSLALTLGLAACAAGNPPADSSAPPQASAGDDSSEPVHLLSSPMTFKVATSQSATGIWVPMMEKAYEKITQLTHGDLQFVIYPNSELGSNIDCVEQILAGAPMILGCGFDTLTDYSDKFAVASAPYVFQDSSEVFTLAQSDWWPAANAELEQEANIKVFAVGSLGYRHFISTKPIRSVSDIPTMVVRMGSALNRDWITVMGGAPTSSTWADNYASLESGIFDACEATLDLLWTSSLYEVCDYLTLSGHSINPNISIMNEDTWNTIPAEYQQIITEVMEQAMADMYDEVVASEQSFIDQFKEKGVEIIQVDKAEFAAYTGDLLKLEKMDDSILEEINQILGH